MGDMADDRSEVDNKSVFRKEICQGKETQQWTFCNDEILDVLDVPKAFFTSLSQTLHEID